MKTKVLVGISILFLSLVAIGITSCNNDKKVKSENAASQEEVIKSKLGDAITEGMKEYPNEKFFIIYDPSTEEIMTVDEKSRMYGEALCTVIGKSTIKGDSYYLKSGAPKGEGWSYAGEASSLVSGLKISREIEKNISLHEGEALEIYMEPTGDGSFKVWYRVIKQ